MYKVTAYFKDYKITQKFYGLYDAIEFKDNVEAHYPTNLIFEKGVYSMRETIVNTWNSVMNANVNPLRYIPDLNTRHMVLQVLAWMWCIIFGFIVSSWTVFGISAIAHVALLAGICLTVGTFETAKRNPSVFNLRSGYHSVSRTRQYMWIDGKKITLDPHDPGGEHI